jgi:formate-dependent nitrite reductase membrane component NrfD
VQHCLSTQKIWGWKVALYMFLTGVGSGAYSVGLFTHIFSPDIVLFPKVGVVLGPPMALAGVLILLSELGRPLIAFRSFCKPQTSWISRGVIFVTLFIILGSLHVAIWIWPFPQLEPPKTLYSTLCIINAVLAILVLVYPGLELGEAKSIPFWDAMLLPLIFLVYGVSTGIASIVMGSSIQSYFAQFAVKQTLYKLLQYYIPVLLLQGLIIIFYLYGSYRSDSSKASAYIVLRGKLAFRFWIGVIGFGIVVPLGLSLVLLLGSGLSNREFIFASLILGAAALIGGLILRHVVLAGAVRPPLYVQGFRVCIS